MTHSDGGPRSLVVFLLTIQYNLHKARHTETPNITQLVRAQRSAMNDETIQAPQNDKDERRKDGRPQKINDERREDERTTTAS